MVRTTIWNDLMSTDGTSVFLHHLCFNEKLEEQEKKSRHPFSTSNFIDDSDNIRTHWFLGYGDFTKLPVAYQWMESGKPTNYGTMVSINGSMIAYDDKAAYVMSRKGYIRRQPNRPFDSNEAGGRDFMPKAEGVPVAVEWKQDVTLRSRTIVRAGDTLVLGGMPDNKNSAFPYDLVEGKRADVIQMYSAADGKETGEIKLPTAVVWDGIAPANDKLYVSTVDGKLTCLE